MNVFQLLWHRCWRTWKYDEEDFRRDIKLDEYQIFIGYPGCVFWSYVSKKEYFIELVKERQIKINKQRRINEEYEKAIKILNGD